MSIIQAVKQALQDNLNVRKGEGLPAHLAGDALFGQFAPPRFSKSQLSEFLRGIWENQGDQAYQAALQRAGVTTLVSPEKAVGILHPSQVNNVGEYWRVAYQFGIDPQLAWDVGIDGEPYSDQIEVDEHRTRWLLWNPESGEYFVITTFDEAVHILTGEGAEYCSDVTGMQAHEEQWQKDKQGDEI